jgi:hypothetical protein
MWEMYVSQRPQHKAGAQPHPQLGKFPASAPASYTLLATACMAYAPAARPSWSRVIHDLSEVQHEMQGKFYTDLCGSTKVGS